jgi:FixJ family two-component response regulator
MNDNATIYLIDDDVFVQKHMTLLARQMGVGCQTFLTAEQFLNAYAGQHPTCVVAEFRLLGMDGIRLQETMVAQGISLPIIFLTAHAFTEMTVRAMKNGAVTVFDKPCSERALAREIQAALLLNDEMSQANQHHLEVRQRVAQLTDKECQVLDLMMEGKPNKVIAKRLGVSLRTVEVRRQHIFQKMNTRSVAELVRLVLACNGLRPGVVCDKV